MSWELELELGRATRGAPGTLASGEPASGSAGFSRPVCRSVRGLVRAALVVVPLVASLLPW